MLAIDRQIETRFADGTTNFAAYNAAGLLVAETNQDTVITLFGYNGAGRLTSVTNAFGTTNQVVTRYLHDEAGNEVAQIDANNQTNRFEADGMGRRIKHTLPGGQTESWSFSSTQGVSAGSRSSYWESYCLARCICEPEGSAGRLGQKGKERQAEHLFGWPSEASE